MKKDNCNIGLDEKVLQAIEEMKVELGEHFSLEKLNLAELGRRTGISRKKLRRLKKNGFAGNPHGAKGRRPSQTLLTSYTAVAGCAAPKGSNEFLTLPGGIAEQWLFRELDYGQEVYCLTPLFGSSQEADSVASGEPWAQVHDGARRNVPDGLGFC